MIPEGSGTRIEGYWGMQPSATFFRRIWFVLVVVLGMPVFFIYAKCAVFQTCPGKSDQWAGLLVPLGLLFLGLLVPRLGAALGLPERRPVVVLVEQVLVAGRGATEMPERAWKSSLDRI